VGKVPFEDIVNPIPRWPTSLPMNTLGLVIRSLHAEVDGLFIAHGNTGFQQKHFRAAVCHELDRFRGFL
jgi:hypothetical protein